MPASWSIRHYLIALVLALALPLVGLLAYSLNDNYQQALEQAKASNHRLSELIAADTARFIQESRGFLEGLAQRPRIRQHDPHDCDPLLAEIKQLFPRFANLAVTDRTGQIVCSARASLGARLPSVSAMQWFDEVRAANRFVVGKPHLGPISKKWVVVLTQPFHDADGHFDGLIGYSLDLAGYRPLAESTELPPGLHVHLIDSQGVVLSGIRIDPREIGQPFADRRALDAVHSVNSAIVGEKERQRLVARAAIAGTDWQVIATRPAEAVLGGLWLRANRQYLGAAFLILLGSLAASYVAHRIVRPVRRIASTARRVADGQLAERAAAEGPREIVAVAEQFNRMLDVRQKTEAQYRNLLESASDGIIVIDERGAIVLANEQADAMFGYERGELLGKPLELLIPHDKRAEHMDWVAAYLKHPVRRQLGRLLRGQRKNGHVFPCDIGLSPLQTEDGLLVSAIVHDLSERVEFQQQLAHLAQHDALTGLPNRSLLLDRLTQAAVRVERNAGQIAVLQLDIDGFGALNDFYGTTTADAILKSCATRLCAHLRDTDTVVRSGSDEFIVVIEDAAAENAALRFIDRLHNEFVRPLPIDEREPVRIRLSGGVALHLSADADIEALLKNADLATIQAKRDGGDAVRFFEADMDARASQRIKLLSHLHNALERNELFLHYQPQVELGGARIVGVEALLRWRNPELGLVSPAQFIPLAEESGLIDAIGDWVLRQACAQGAQWRRAGLPPLVIAVNLSTRQFRQSRLVERIEDILRDSGLPAQHLELEITEGMLMQNPELATATLHALHRLGVRISIDDFGTGYSSLSYLKRFPVHALKIDQSFVRDLPGNTDDIAIVTAIVSLATSLRLGVIAEGIETAEQHAFLLGLNCPLGQGYLFSRPVAPEEIAAKLGAQSSS